MAYKQNRSITMTESIAERIVFKRTVAAIIDILLVFIPANILVDYFNIEQYAIFAVILLFVINNIVLPNILHGKTTGMYFLKMCIVDIENINIKIPVKVYLKRLACILSKTFIMNFNKKIINSVGQYYCDEKFDVTVIEDGNVWNMEGIKLKYFESSIPLAMFLVGCIVSVFLIIIFELIKKFLI